MFEFFYHIMFKSLDKTNPVVEMKPAEQNFLLKSERCLVGKQHFVSPSDIIQQWYFEVVKNGIHILSFCR